MTSIFGRLGLQGTVVIESTHLRWNLTAPAISSFTYGSSDMIPLVGDWNGDGVEGIGAYQPSTGTFFLKQTATGGDADIALQYGAFNLIPISWYDTYSIGFSKGDGIGVIQGNTVFLDKDLSGGYAEIYTTTDKISCGSGISQCKFLCGNIRIHVRDEALNFIGGYDLWLDGINKGEIIGGNLLFDSIDNGNHTCQIKKIDGTVISCNYCTGSDCTPISNSSNCSVPITIITDATVLWRFTILCTTPLCTFSIS